MQGILSSSGWFFPWVLRASWQASLVIGLVLLVQWIFRRQLSPRWRYGLWLLVMVRLILPVSIESQFSLFNWVGPKSDRKQAQGSADPASAVVAGQPAVRPVAESNGLPSEHGRENSIRKVLIWIWLVGALALPAYLLLNGFRLTHHIRQRRQITDETVLSVLEDCKQEMGVCTPIVVVETGVVSSPCLFGFLRPRLILPEGLIGSFSPSELRHVFLHELSHLKRGDIAMNWLITLALVVHWFNPVLWYAWSRMRMDRELACDALALSRARDTENRAYGQTIIKLLEGFNRPAMSPGLVGILENKNQMKRRITMIAKFKKTNRWSVVAALVCGVLAVFTLTDGKSGQPSNKAGANDSQGPPQIVSTSPQAGETEVSPNLSEITVTFDRDMSGGFSWTGGGPDYPTSPEGKKPMWRDKRTCVLPVKLQTGHFYRVGINSTSYQNFRSADGVAAKPSAIYFTTTGASEELKRKAMKPVILGLEPKNGAQDVDPALKELRITFNVPMGEGFSWTGGGPQFPTIPEGKKASWSADHKTCVLPVELKPGWEYQLGLNSPSHKNFQSAGGVPLEPVRYTFKTR